MPGWFTAILALCAVALTAAAVPLLVALLRTVRRAEAVLGIVERELSPLVAELHGLTDALRDVVRETEQELKRVGVIVARLDDVAAGVARVVTALAGLTRAGQFFSLAAAIRKGVDVFVERLRNREGESHG
jgi:uncharacterized protein YoxC